MSLKRSVRLISEDAERLSEFLHAQPAKAKRFFHPFPFDVESVRAALADESMYICKLEDSGEIAAIWMLLNFNSKTPEFGLIVDADRRREGYGQLAIRLAKATAKQLNKSGLQLAVYPDNEPARKLYEEAGFEETGRMPDGQIRMEWLI